MRTFIQRHPGLPASIALPDKPGANNRRLLALVNENKLRRVLARMLDQDEFLAPYGIRSLSRCYAANPYVLSVEGSQVPVRYLPAESDSATFGGNTNWRGPIWFPFNFLLVHSLRQFHLYYGDAFKVECPTGSGRLMDLSQIAREIAGRLCAIFLKDPQGRRPLYGGTEIFAADPYWRDLILFYEYFHGDNGAGIGASHQTGWTGLVARLLHLRGTVAASSATPGRIAEAFPRARAS
jgi:hypothetical protein